MPLSLLDIFLIIIMLISGFLAMLRGFTREVLSILSWAAAAVAALLLFPQYQAEARAMIEPPLLADGVLAGGIFLVVLIVVSLITARISDRVLDSRIGALDRTLGFVYGLARGLILVVILYLFYSWLVPENTQQRWILDARSLPLIKRTGEFIVSLLPEDPGKFIRDKTGGGDDGTEGDGAAPQGVDRQSRLPEDRSTARAEATGVPGLDDSAAVYRSGERQGLDQLLESARGARQ